MAGLLDLLNGWGSADPKLKGFVGNALTDLGYGLSTAPDFGSALGAATERTAQMSGVRMAEEEKRKADQLAANQSNATLAYFQKKYPDLADKVQAGMPVNEAWNEAMAREKPGYGQPEMTANMRDYQFAQANPGYAEFLNPPSSGGNLPSSVQEYEYAKSQGYGGSLIDYERDKKAAGRSPMDATTKKELFEADDAAKAGEYVLSALDEAISLNDKAYDGPTADLRGDATALWGDEAGVATARMKNVTTELALSQLKTIFGSMPTEGERKILLELQGSVNQAKPVRAAILKRAREMAERRIMDNKAKADALRSGAYFDEGYGQSAPGGDADVENILSGLGI